MLELPKESELHRQLPVKVLCSAYKLSDAERKLLEAEIADMTFVNELSARTTGIDAGEHVKQFFVLAVALKRKDAEKKILQILSTRFPMRLLLCLTCGSEAKLAVHHTLLVETGWKRIEDLSVTLTGQNLDDVWLNAVIGIGNITVEPGRTLEEQIEFDAWCAKLKPEIDRLDRMARRELQPRRKYELAKQCEQLRQRLKDGPHGQA